MRVRTLILLLFLLAVASPAAAELAVPADFQVMGVVTRADHQHYRDVPFDVPAGVERITVILSYDKANKTVIDMGVRDPMAFRGWSGGTRDRFTISPSDASPGYLAGAIPAGRWRVVLGVPNARAGSRSTYTVSVFFDRGKKRKATAAIAGPPLNDAPGWYRGDLHMHDANSDGSCLSQSGKRVPCPLFRTVEAAARAGLDFVAVTDHNTVAHFGALRELQPWFDRLLLIPGVEVTTFGGHANIFAPSHVVDFRVGGKQVPTVAALERKVAEAGAIMSINHPALPSGELCMGCGWTWPATDYAGITAIEAVNGTMAEGPLAGIGFWYARLNEGHRLTGIGGSDNHDPDMSPGKAPIGRPTTVVHAESLSTSAIIDGIRGGNVFIDVDGSRDRLLELQAVSGTASAAMGQTLPLSGSLELKVHVVGMSGGNIQVIANGSPLGALRAPVTMADQWSSFALDRAMACGWISATVLAGGHPKLIGNPIYIRCA
ncbi:CehA/McbA family metallohydrolase [Sphingomonas alpina]|uniref:CehA/McbA family metallohydrolase n=1 Tax=Sphingomonas alpina TaxID=653931 RepID=A0A7H0LNS8_9SPHN|nr:CehA/McbA family metallohydrolase [Sphingomonas alpina]QNQ11331.1 CehA/McbA family metallohydrolase [Sphingomonas alpina]